MSKDKTIIITGAGGGLGAGIARVCHREGANVVIADIRGDAAQTVAQSLGDNALAVSRLLVERFGGPSVFPYQPDGVWFNPYSGDRWVMSSGGDQHRRGLYTFWRRTAPYAAFMAFDAPSREVCAERRPRTNTPLQALATLNDRFFVESSAALARRIVSEGRGGVAERAGGAGPGAVPTLPPQSLP